MFVLVPSVLSDCYSSSDSSFTVFLSPKERGLMKTPHLGLSVSKTLTLCTVSGCGQGEASVMMAERGTDQ